MNRSSKYYFIMKNMVVGFIIVLIISVIIKISNIYSNLNEDFFQSIIIILKTSNTLLIISLCLASIFIIIQTIAYLNSGFYKIYKINIFEAFYKGILDLYLIHDKIKQFTNSKDIQIDFQNNILYFSDKDKYYSIIFMDIFGQIEGTLDSDFWSVGRRARKQFGRKIYTRQIRFENPFRVNNEFIKKQKLKTGKKFESYVIISGYYKTRKNIKNIISPYEIISIVT
ncbi:hypothetical protein RJI07_03770 [Mycoplasmatota bacterium WC30]